MTDSLDIHDPPAARSPAFRPETREAGESSFARPDSSGLAPPSAGSVPNDEELS